MKYILILLVIISQLIAKDTKQEVTIGAGAYLQTQPYKNTDAILLPSPVIFFDNSIVYVRWTRAGIYFLGDKQDNYSWGFSLTIQPRPYGYLSSDSKNLAGMDERKTSFEGGLAFSTKLEKTYFEIMALTDILDRHDSWLIKAELGDDFKIGNFSFYPSIIAIYNSAKFMDYYYGVKNSEVITDLRPAYKADAGLQFGAQTYISYPLTDNVSAFINLRVDRLPQEATNSPIVSDDFIYSGLASLIYTFQY